MKDHARGFLSLVEQALSKVPEVDVYQVKNRLDKGEHFMLIDVREDYEVDLADLVRQSAPAEPIPSLLSDEEQHAVVDFEHTPRAELERFLFITGFGIHMLSV